MNDTESPQYKVQARDVTFGWVWRVIDVSTGETVCAPTPLEMHTSEEEAAVAGRKALAAFLEGKPQPTDWHDV